MDSIFTSFRIELILDWLIIGFISYKTLSILRGTRALNILLGFIVLSLVYFISVKIQLPYSQKILSYFFDNLILIIIILFQEDLRRVLANVGRKTTFFTSKEMTQKEVSKNIAKVSAQLAKENIGALIVIEKQDKLADVISSGSRLNSLVKPEFIYPIFLPNSPIHDGAIIISQGTIAAAGCLLPLSKDAQLNKKFGTRHKAAIGLTEKTDALVIVISEETGQIHLASGGKLTYNLDENQLKESLFLIYDEINKKSKFINLFKRS